MYLLKKSIQSDPDREGKQFMIRFALIPSTLFFLGMLLATNCSSNPVSPLELKQIEIDGYTWTYLGLEDKWVTAVEDTPWGLFAGTREEGVFRFDEETGGWTSLGLDRAPISDIAFADCEKPRIFVGVCCCIEGQEQYTPAAVFASFDRGNTWLESDGGLAKKYEGNLWARTLLVDHQNPDRVFFGQDVPQLFKSDDGGQSWDFISGNYNESGGGMEFIVLSPKRDGRIWFGGQTAFFSPAIYRSDDWGRDAEVVYIPEHDGWVAKIIVDTINPDLLWMIETGRVAMSVNAGETWETILAPALEPSNETVLFNGLLMDNEILFAAGARTLPQTYPWEHELRLYRSMNQGASWDTLAVPEGAIGARGLEFDRNMNLLIPTANGLWRVER